MRLLLLLLLASSLSAGALAQGIFDDNEARRRIDRLRQEVEAHRQATEARIAKAEQAAQEAAERAGDRGALIELSGQLEGVRSEMARTLCISTRPTSRGMR